MRTFFAVLALSLGFISPGSAQSKPKLFESYAKCDVALRSGEFNYYIPIDLRRVGENPAVGPNKKVAPLEADGCFGMQTTAGWKFVVLPEGTEMRWEFMNGKWEVYAHHKCGNKARLGGYLTPLPSTPSPAPASPFVARASTPDTLVHKHTGQIGIKVEPSDATRVAPDYSEESYKVRGSGPSTGTILGIIAGAAAIAGGTYLLVDALSGNDEEEGRPPHVTSDSAVVHGKCTATSYPNNCPGGGPSASISRFNDRPEEILIPLLDFKAEPILNLGPSRGSKGINFTAKLGVKIPVKIF